LLEASKQEVIIYDWQLVKFF